MYIQLIKGSIKIWLYIGCCLVADDCIIDVDFYVVCARINI